MSPHFIKLTNAREAPSAAETWVNLALVTRLSRTARGTTLLNFAAATQDARGMAYVDRVEVVEPLEEILKQLESATEPPAKPRSRRKALSANGLPAQSSPEHQAP
jgi:hypothetical protein